jgi:lipopolysaccharide transport system ATP-binding protein
MSRREVPDSISHWALKDVSFELKRGETIGVMGRNGCGKSTLLELISGILRPTSGEVEVRGELAALLELGSGFSPDLTGRENVYVYGSLLGMSRGEINSSFEEIVEFAEIAAFIDEPVKNYSSGMFVRLAFSVAINSTPEILIVDEALSVGDEAFQRRCFARIARLKEMGTSLLFVSHAAGTILELCDRALLLDRGEMIQFGAPREVVKQYHRLIYAPREEQDSIRTQIMSGLGADVSPGSEVASGTVSSSPVDESISNVLALEDEAFDSGFQSKSKVEYACRGARISDYGIESPDGKRVNVLKRGQLYFVVFDVRFENDCHGVRFGMLIKTVVGTELGGVVSSSAGEGIEVIRRGRSMSVRIPFRPRLSPDVYFTNVGVVGQSEDGEIFLHRIADAVIFRVIRERDSVISGWVDFSSGEEAQIEMAPDLD